MNFKRAFRIGFLVYIASFILGIAYAILAGLDMTTTSNIPTNLYIAGALISLVLSIASTIWYFKPEELKPSAKAGMYFGIILIVIGFILDSLPLIAYYLSEAGGDTNPFVYYADAWFWLTVALVIGGATATGYYLGERS